MAGWGLQSRQNSKFNFWKALLVLVCCNQSTEKIPRYFALKKKTQHNEFVPLQIQGRCIYIYIFFFASVQCGKSILATGESNFLHLGNEFPILTRHRIVFDQRLNELTQSDLQHVTVLALHFSGCSSSHGSHFHLVRLACV